MAIHREIGDRREEGRVLGHIGTAYGNVEQDQEALESYEQALAITREIGNRFGEGSALGNIGNMYKDIVHVFVNSSPPTLCYWG